MPKTKTRLILMKSIIYHCWEVITQYFILLQNVTSSENNDRQTRNIIKYFRFSNNNI